MPRITLACWGSLGDLYPSLGVALGLKGRGHDPVLVTQAAYREIVEGQGIAFRPLRPEVGKDDFALVGRIMDAKRGPEIVFRELLLSAIREQYEDIREAAAGADLLITHPATPAGPIVAEKVDLPWASIVLAPTSFLSVHDPTVLPQAPWFVHLARRSTWVGRAINGLGRRIIDGWAAPLYALRADLGLPRGGSPLFEAQFSPELTLALFSPLLAEPQPDWPRHVEVTGFVPFNGGGCLSPEAEAFLDVGPPPVVFTLGSSAVEAPGTFFRESGEAARRIGVRAVLLIGRNPANRVDGLASKDVLVVESASHAELFPRAAAIVHQCGAGTMGQALRSGRPMLAVPFAHDQYDNADRLARLGVARVLYPKRYSVTRAARELDALLGSASFRNRAEEVGRAARNEDGVARACDAVERLVDRVATRGKSSAVITRSG